MILPKDLLDQISYYEYNTQRVNRFATNTLTQSKFILHFKQWWKPSKTIFINWLQRTTQDGDLLIFEEPDESRELRDQLHLYIQDRN